MDEKRALIALACLLVLYATMFVAIFPNATDTISHYSTVEFTHRDGFARYTYAWYAGSPILTVYSLGFFAAHLLAQIAGSPAFGYLAVEFAALGLLAYACILFARRAGLANAARGEREGTGDLKPRLLAFLTIASPAVFYAFIRLDRFPTTVGAALGVLALSQALSLKTTRDYAKLGALCALTAMASVHAFLIAAVFSAYVILFRSPGIKNLASHASQIGIGAVAFILLELPHALSVLQFLPYNNKAFVFEPHTPLVLLSWLGPLLCAAIAWTAADWAAKAVKTERRALLLAGGIALAAALLLTGWATSANSLILFAEFAIFLATIEAFKLFSQNVPTRDDYYLLGLAGFFTLAALSRSFLLPGLESLNPNVYLIFASLFASAWLVRNANSSPRGAIALAAMALLSVPFHTIAIADYFPDPAGVKAVTDYLSGSGEWGRVMYSNCPLSYMYATTHSGKPSVDGWTIYTITSPTIRRYDSDKNGPAKREILEGRGRFKVKWVVSCLKGEGFAQHGFYPAFETQDFTIWENPESQELVDGADYEFDGNTIKLRGQPGTTANVSLAYYPTLACTGCTLFDKGDYTQVTLTSENAEISVRDSYFWQLAASAGAALLLLVVL